MKGGGAGSREWPTLGVPNESCRFAMGQVNGMECSEYIWMQVMRGSVGKAVEVEGGV